MMPRLMVCRRSYLAYLRFCLRVQVTPLSPEAWDGLTCREVIKEFEAWAKTEASEGWSDEEVPFARPHREGDILLVDCYVNGMKIGKLTRSGGVRPVRHWMDASGGKPSRAEVSRVCHTCADFLPPSRYARQAKGRRAICKKCDSKKRVARRRASRLGAK